MGQHYLATDGNPELRHRKGNINYREEDGGEDDDDDELMMGFEVQLFGSLLIIFLILTLVVTFFYRKIMTKCMVLSVSRPSVNAQNYSYIKHHQSRKSVKWLLDDR